MITYLGNILKSSVIGFCLTLMIGLSVACQNEDRLPILMEPATISGCTFAENELSFSCNDKDYSSIFVTFDSIPGNSSQMSLNIYGLQRNEIPVIVDVTPFEEGFVFEGSFQHPHYPEFDFRVKGKYGTVEESFAERSKKLVEIECDYIVNGYIEDEKSIIFYFDKHPLSMVSLGNIAGKENSMNVHNKINNDFLSAICERISQHTTALKFYFRPDGKLDISVMKTGSEAFTHYMTVEYWPNLENSQLLNLSFTEEQAEKFMEDWYGKPSGGYSPPFYNHGYRSFMTICVWKDPLRFSWFMTGPNYYSAWSMFLRTNGIKGLEGQALEDMQLMYTYLWDAYDLESDFKDFDLPSSFLIAMTGEWE